jgi:tetratricopeptide (TPR) repeat protein
MEKESVLVACLKTLIVFILAAAFTSCSLPRFVILHDPLTPEEHVNLGVSYEKRSELDAALKEYREASKNLPLAHLYMGNVYFQQKEYRAAERSYRKAIRKTGAAEAYNNLAWLYYTTGRDLTRAEGLARKAVELSPDSEDFKDTLDKVRERLKHQGLSFLPSFTRNPFMLI